jgi:biopolymer transport protein ExbB/TolQ
MTISEYFAQSGVITFIVIATLSFYFIATLTIFIYRYRAINRRLKVEHEALAKLYTSNDATPDSSSILYSYINRSDGSLDKIFKAAISDAIRVSTKGLTQLSIMASTSPFIGLFGTVVGILDAFSRLGNVKSASLAVVAPAISEALIATAVGIFVAIFAYSFNLLLKRKVYELNSTLESLAEILVSRSE